MLAGERKQVRAALLDLAEKRSLTSEFWSSRDCRYFVNAAVSGGSHEGPDLLSGGSDLVASAFGRKRERRLGPPLGRRRRWFDANSAVWRGDRMTVVPVERVPDAAFAGGSGPRA
jgi:hypothetical protein